MLKLIQQVRLYARFSPAKTTHDIPRASSKVSQIEIHSKKETIVQNRIIDLTDETPEYSKEKDINTHLKQIMVSIKSRKNRDKHERILLEGKRLIKDAVDSGCVPETILFSRVEDMKNLSLPMDGVKIYKIPYKMISMWSDTSTSPGILGIFKTPDVESKRPARDALPLTVVCDNVREPGNLGAILRVAAGVGCQRIILSRGCVDLWEPKVLRSAAGAHFHLPIHRNATFSDVARLLPPISHVFLADNNADDPGQSLQRILPALPYDAVDFTLATNTVVVIGGETEGLSDDAMRLAAETNGARLHIPLGNDVESLNSGAALAVVLFEIKRQLMSKDSVTDDRRALAGAEGSQRS